MKLRVSFGVLLACSVLATTPALAGWSPLNTDSAAEMPILRDTPGTEETPPTPAAAAPTPEESDAASITAPKPEWEEQPHPEVGLATDGEEDKEEAVEEESKKPVVPGEHPTEKVTDPVYFFNKSVSFLKDAQYQSALNYINKALELQPKFWKAWYQKALIYQFAGHDGAAARRYLTLLQHRPDMLEAHIAMGSLYRKHNNLNLAETEYKAAIEINCRSFEAHFNLANLLMDQKRMEEALKEYKTCLKIKPNNAHVHNNIGVIYQERNYIEDAIDEFKKASNLEPANKAYFNNLQDAKTKLSKKQTANAKKVM